MSEHTKTPWKLYKAKLRPDISDVVIVEVQDQNGKSIIKWGGFDGQKNRDTNAAFIVRACNSHERLVMACERAKLILESEDTHYKGEPAREAAIEALTLINAAIDSAESK